MVSVAQGFTSSRHGDDLTWSYHATAAVLRATRAMQICSTALSKSSLSNRVPFPARIEWETQDKVHPSLSALSPPTAKWLEFFGQMPAQPQSPGNKLITTEIGNFMKNKKLLYLLETRPIQLLTATILLGVVVTSVYFSTTALALAEEPPRFSSTSGEYPVTAKTTVSKEVVLEGEGDSISCGKIEYSTELKEESEKLVLTPSYSECTGDIEGLELSATVSPGSCKIEIEKMKTGTETEGEVTELTGEDDVGTSGCGPIKMEVPTDKCTFEASAQGPVTGTTTKPDGESGIEITSKLSSASVTVSSGCHMPCPKMEHPGFTVWLIIHGVIKLYQEIFGLRVKFWMHGKEIPLENTQLFNPGERTTVEIRNPYAHWPILEWEMRNKNNKWLYYTIAGEPGSVGICYSVFYFPTGKCKFEIEAPTPSKEADEMEIWGRFFFRGKIKVEVT
jgi:hypothetical protein